MAQNSLGIHRLLLAWLRCTTLGGADHPAPSLCCTCMSICTSLCTTSVGVALTRSSSSSKLATEASGGGLRKSGQCFSRHIAASRGERSVPGRTRRARCPRRVHRVASVVEEHPEAYDRLPEGAGGEAHLGEVFGSEGDSDHGRATFK